METIQDKLRKIAALAAGGIGGERENAERMLRELSAKHGLSLEQLTAEEKEWHTFTASDRFERDLLTQVLIHVCQTREIPNIARPKGIKVELTAVQAADVREAFDHYRAIWRRDVADFATAFIHKNQIYGPASTSSAPVELDAAERERLRRLRALMLGMSENRWERHLKLGDGRA